MLMRTTGSFGVAALLTVSLYYAMSMLIQTSGVPVFTEAAPRIIPTIYKEKEPEPPVKKQPPERLKPVEPPKFERELPTILKPGKSGIGGPTVLPRDEAPDLDDIIIDRPAQPIFRQEPDFRNITKMEFVTVAFDVRPDGSVEKSTIFVLESSSSRMERPAIQAVKKWKYQPKVVNGETVWQRNERVRFTVEPPK